MKLRKGILMSTYALLEISVISRFHLSRNGLYALKLLSLFRRSEIYSILKPLWMIFLFQILDLMSVILWYGQIIKLPTWDPELSHSSYTHLSRLLPLLSIPDNKIRYH